MPDPFAVPSEIEYTGESEFARFSDMVGELLLIKPTAYEDGLTGKNTKPGETYDRVTATVTVINTEKPKESETHADLYITPGRCVGKLKGHIDSMVLARLQRDTPTNQNPLPPYNLDDPSEDDAKAARAFLAGADEPPF